MVFVSEGTFVLTPEEWGDIFRNGRLVDYSVTIRRKFALVNNTCLLNFKGIKYRKSKRLVVYGYCAHYGCKTFALRITFSSEKITVSIFSSTSNFNHPVRKTLYVKGIERYIVKNQLRSIKASEYRQNTVLESSPLLIKCGNYQNIKSTCVVRKIRSEKLSKYDRDPDEVMDIILRRRESASHIQGVEPFYVYLFSKEQLEICKIVAKAQPMTVHIDATGGVVRPPQSADKRVLYYAGAIRVEMVSCRHDTSEIGKWLVTFKNLI